ncbi:hypothetical protein GTZ78_06280 [Streptomyces sp. SID8361]|uniref:acetylxylan esterase n=1 Tax=Streptomyces sp. MnatMP-M27 TaxID=1839768 RepID=UPI000D19C53B|nr:hypothetical protein [Streptomyces sp. SID8361]
MAGYRSAEFSGFGGHRIRGRLLVPRDAAGPLPCMVRCLGYNSGRGLPHNWLLSPDDYYYRRLYTDEVRAVEAAREHPPVGPARIVVSGAVRAERRRWWRTAVPEWSAAAPAIRPSPRTAPIAAGTALRCS